MCLFIHDFSTLRREHRFDRLATAVLPLKGAGKLLRRTTVRGNEFSSATPHSC